MRPRPTYIIYARRGTLLYSIASSSPSISIGFWAGNSRGCMEEGQVVLVETQREIVSALG